LLDTARVAYKIRAAAQLSDRSSSAVTVVDRHDGRTQSRRQHLRRRKKDDDND
jgi:hypothetical protein